MGMRVLLVEDDQAIASPLVRGLEREGFTVRHCETGAEALATFAAEPTDVVLLDLGLPDVDGFDLCREVRTRSEVPIIVVTARGDEIDRVVGLELGADDYVVKPFGLRELVARIRAVTRRSSGRNEAADDDAPDDPPRLHVDQRTRRVVVDGTEVPLTPKEFDLLALLAHDPGAVCSRQRILDEVWDPHWYGPTKTLDVHIGSLRRKLGDPRWIETVRGVGYRLREDGARV
jgi:two-component system response regulator RegX3